jgi:hypothetical protein
MLRLADEQARAEDQSKQFYEKNCGNIPIDYGPLPWIVDRQMATIRMHPEEREPQHSGLKVRH